MECLRIILHQTSANYRKEETVDNKMTYPLPPFSTVIGALHKACGYTETHPMDISIQGKFESMHRKPYRDYCFLNSTMDDRGILVKMLSDSAISNAFVRVSSAKKPQGSSHKDGITIKVENEELLEEYRQLKNLADEIKDFKNNRLKPVLNKLKERKNKFAKLKKSVEKNSDEYKKYLKRENRIKEFEKQINERMKEFETNKFVVPFSKFRVLTTSLKFYEILDEIDLIIHIHSDEQTLKDIESNIYNLKSIGRSEDFVEVKSCERVELLTEIGVNEVMSKYSAYIDIDAIRDGIVFTRIKENRSCMGTKYTLNKLYKPGMVKRIFEKKKVLYISDYTIEECDEDSKVFYDGEYIVNLI